VSGDTTEAAPRRPEPQVERPRSATQSPAEPREYQCSSCGRRETARATPFGWSVVLQSQGIGTKACWLGSYCTTSCLTKAQRRLELAAARHAQRHGLPVNDRAVLDSLFKRAHRHILEDGLSIRATGDLLGIPTQVLRRWLSAVGISVSGPSLSPHASRHPSTIGDFLTQGHFPSSVNAIHEAEMAGHIIQKPVWSYSVTGPPHDPTFTCTVQVTTVAGDQVTEHGVAHAKPRAKAAAAHNLIATLSSPSTGRSAESSDRFHTQPNNPKGK
jgi:hypothetical protein